MANKQRLIDANLVKEKAVPHYFDNCCYAVSVKDIDDAPTVDAVEVVHGRWIEKQEQIPWCEDDVEIFFECSICGTQSPEESPYCPNCGAKMDGDGNEDGS